MSMFAVLLSVLSLINLTVGQLSEGKNHPCYRDCKANSLSKKICEYEFHVEWFQTLTNACFNCPQTPDDCYRHDCVPADGIERIIQVVNRRMPGPKIEVCEGDDVVVTVHNDMDESSTTIHWHGIHQKGTQFMDGVPYVTQCPNQPQSIFKYRFSASAGTHFWHSHIGLQRGNGITGALIVRRSLSQERKLYDYDLSEHIVLIQDWTESPPNDLFIKRYFDRVKIYPRSLLINGLGRFINGQGETRGVPAARFVVNSGSRYRFRIIASTFMDVPVVFHIDKHKFTVIASDGSDLVPVIADSLTIFSGERYDIVLEANQDNDLYWMRFQGLIMGETGQAHQAAVLQYSKASSTDYPNGEPTWKAAASVGQQVNGLNMPANNIPIDQLRAIKSDVLKNPSTKLYLAFDLHEINDPRFQLSQPSPTSDILNLTEVSGFNDILLKLFSFPLLSQKYQIDEKLYCSPSTIGFSCKEKFCRCPYIIKVQLGSVVELIFIDEGSMRDATHPVHLHGHYFQVIGSGRIGNTTTEAAVRVLDKQGHLKRNLINPPLKDTVQVPDGGYTIVRFVADNIGFWLLHCHVDFHMLLGMELVFQVGERDKMPSAPKGFPKCGDFTNSPLPML